MSDKSAERVLGLPTANFHSAGLFQGFRPFDPILLAFLLDPAHLEYRPRGEAEHDPSFKQLIPYVILRHRGDLFHYTRGRGGTETRLRARRSVGIGGHICSDDADSPDPYRTGMLRELAEEVEIGTPFRESTFGLINDDSTPVGSVHLGVVHLLDLDQPSVTPREADISESGFASVRELLSHANEFESWSRLAMEAIAE